MNSPHKGQWRGFFMFSLICVWINGWVNNREAGDLRRYRAHYNVTVMVSITIWLISLVVVPTPNDQMHRKNHASLYVVIAYVLISMMMHRRYHVLDNNQFQSVSKLHRTKWWKQSLYFPEYSIARKLLPQSIRHVQIWNYGVLSCRRWFVVTTNIVDAITQIRTQKHSYKISLMK